MMDIRISNCNNILSGSVSVAEGRLNIKYAINGTGKSTVSKAIEYASRHDNVALNDLMPYQYIGDKDPSHAPSVCGLPADIKIAMFDEKYVEQYVFQEDELLKDSFEIFVKTDNYEQHLAVINQLVSSVRTVFDDHPELDDLLSAVTEFISVFGNARAGIANNGALVKGMSRGNLIENIPSELEEYSIFLTNEQNSKWLKWQATGRAYMELGNKCPFCAVDLTERRKIIDRINAEYDAKTIEHLSKILDLFERLGQYFSTETNEKVRIISTNVQGLNDEQKGYLVGIRREVEILYNKLIQLKRIGFDSLKDIDRLANVIPSFKIDMQFFVHLRSKATEDKVAIINAAIDHLLVEVGKLQGAVAQQKIEIQNTVKRYSSEINSFLRIAGYNYSVSLDETTDHTYKLLLKYGDDCTTVSSARNHLSFGERNALALVLFMYQAIYNQANFIVLDDPISSFDKNKKFAILDRLFVQGGGFRGKTSLLLTHDFEPVIDAIYNYSDYFDHKPVAFFVENNNGILSEKIIQKDDIISSIRVADTNINRSTHNLIKLIYLRRKIEVINGKNNAWHLLSNLFHKRQIPMLGENDRQLTLGEIADGTNKIKERVPDFEYFKYYGIVSNRDDMIALYQNAQSNYEKLQIYRLIVDAKAEDHVLRKFLNATYHVENDYLFQLNPLEYNTVPNYIIAECDQSINVLMMKA